MSNEQTYTKNAIEKARTNEEIIKHAIAKGLSAEFIKGYMGYEEAILHLESVGKHAEAVKLAQRLIKIMDIIDEKGDRNAPKYARLGPFFILQANRFKARILERINEDLTEATAARVKALELAKGTEALEEIMNIMINLLLEDHVEFGIRYLEYAQQKKEELISAIAEQIQQSKSTSIFSKLFSFSDPYKDAKNIYRDFIHLLGLMLEKKKNKTSFLNDALQILKRLRRFTTMDYSYLDERFLALEAKIRSSQEEFIDIAEISHVESKIIPHTILDDPQIKELETLLKKYIRQKNFHDLDVKVGVVPLLGANPAGPPHLTVLGQTGAGKTTFVKHVILENRRAQNTTIFVVDHHSEYADIATTIIQFGGEETEDATLYYPMTEVGDTFKQARELIQKQVSQFSGSGVLPEDLAAKMQAHEEDTRKSVRNFVIETVEKILEEDEDKIFSFSSEDPQIFVIWVHLDDTEIENVVVDTIIKHLLQLAISGKLTQKVIFVNEEAQRLAGSQWVRNVSSEGRKFGLYQISISQVPEFDPWVIRNSEVAVFRLRGIMPSSPLNDTIPQDLKALIPQLDPGEYLSYDRSEREWFLGYNVEALSPIHAKATLERKINQIRSLVK